jgi:cytochrome c biogenesis protein
MWGFQGFVNIPEGESANHIMLRKSGALHNLDFEIRCDDFSVSFYDSGAPEEFRSSVTILEEGQPVLQKDIVVNDPLRYKGTTMYQTTYGELPLNKAKKINLNFASMKTGKVYEKSGTLGNEVEIPEGLGRFLVKEIRNSYELGGHNLGEAIIGTLISEDGNPVDIAAPLKFPGFDKMRRGSVVVSVGDVNRGYYTGLQVSRDPGVPIVYASFTLMIIGFYLTFFVSHQRLYIEVKKRGNGARVTVAGSANKSRLGMRNKVKKISQQLAAGV